MEEAVSVKKEKKPLHRPLKVGDEIRIVTLDKTGTVLAPADHKGMVEVQVGIIRTRVPVDQVEFAPKSARPAEQTKGKSVYTLGRDTRQVMNEVDIRGMTLLEAEPVVEQFLDQCRMSGLTTVSIIHGKGTGALRQGVHALLKRDKSVESFRLGVYGEGETGVTIVTLKQK